MRARWSLLVCSVAAAVGLVAGCGKNPTNNTSTTPPTGGVVAPAKGGEQYVHIPDNPNPDVGARLFKPAPFPPEPPLVLGADPIVIPQCTVAYDERQQVSAEVDGKIDLIASPLRPRADGVYEWTLPDGTVVTHDPKAFDLKSLHPSIVFNPRDQLNNRDKKEKWVPYWRLREGDQVYANQVLCVLDDQSVGAKMRGAEKKKEAAAKARDAATEGVELTKEKMKLYEDPRLRAAMSRIEILNDQVTLTRFIENLAQALQTIAQAEADHEEAQVVLARHKIGSRVEGIIRSIAKRPGEFVRAGEKIFEIQSTEKVRLEGNLDVQYLDRVRRNMDVAIEPALPSTPVWSRAGHRQEVAGVAVTGQADCPLVVSVGLDGVAQVWDPNLKNQKGRVGIPQSLPHPGAGVAVRCVAATPPGAPVVRILTGADDGRVRVWDVLDSAALKFSPAREFPDAHLAGISAAAVSPDGKFAATAAGSEVFIWDLAAGKRLYSLPPEHRDTVTSVTFTPQATLVTASKDRTLKEWRLGAEKAAPTRTIDHRSGVVDVLGVSPDGGRALFDQDKSRIDVLDLTDPREARTVGTLSNVGPSVAFATLAVFGLGGDGPDAPYTVATAGGDGDLKGGLQVWLMPRAGGRGAEFARVITPGRAAVTCAAFSPFKNDRFLVVGTGAGTVHVWTLPKGPTVKLSGKITNIDFVDPRYATVRVEMSNQGIGLRDRSTATVIVGPNQ